MGLIADLVASFAQLPVRWLQAARGVGQLADVELGEVANATTEAVRDFVETQRDKATPELLADILALAVVGVAPGLTVSRFKSQLFRGWSTLLARAFGALNVDVERGAQAAVVDPATALVEELERGRRAAQDRVAAALTIINAVVIAGNAASVAAEIATIGFVRSIAEAVQSFIWANGLGSFSPLAFQPQVQASIAPYLVRHYNSRAQATIPPVTDIIRFQLREMFLAGRREELVGEEARPVFNLLMQQHGFNEFHADSYWGAHWQLPSQGQLNEMLHRSVIDLPTWERFTRFNDVEPTSIPRLQEIIYRPFTRVDVRRMSRFGLLSDGELLQAYADLGFFAPTEVNAAGKRRAVMVANPDFTVHKAQAQVAFTKVFNAVPELRRRFSKGWIGPEEVRDGLLATGIPAARAELVAQTIIKADTPARTAPERELTRALITRAWKQRLISFSQALFLLERIGWAGAEAELILRVQSQPDDPLAFVQTQLGARLTDFAFPVQFGELEEGEIE